MIGDYLGGGDAGFVSNSEGASASLDITMSEDSARNLWDVQAAIQQIAADLQTAVRAAADFDSYLISMRENAQTLRMPELGIGGGAGGNMEYSGRVDSSSVPGALQSEAGMASRIEEMAENSSGMGGGALAARAPGRPFDPGEAVGQMTNIAWMASMTGQHGTAPETLAAYEREYEFARNNPRHPLVRRASYGGQTGTPRAFAASQIVAQGLPAAQQFLRGGGVGGAAALLGRLGTYGAIAYGGYQLASAGLETYAQSRALAIAANNSELGTGWGFGTRVEQAGMALSPFVSQEEASQIYDAAISQGWASRGPGFAQGDFSSAVNFMYGAAKDYGMAPEMSAKLLQTNSLEAGQSVSALSEQLLTLKQTLDGTGVSMSAATAAFTDATSFFISAGASGTDAAIMAGGTLKSFAGNTVLGPNGAGLRVALEGLNQPGVQNIIGALQGNLGAASLAGPNARKGYETYQGILHSLAKQYSSQTGTSWENRVAMFMSAYQSLTGTAIDFNKAEQLFTEASADPNFLTRGQADYEEKSTLGELKEHGLWSRNVGAWDYDIVGGDYREYMGRIDTYQYYNEEVNNLLGNAGDNLKNLTLYGPDGKPVTRKGHEVAGAEIAAWFNSQENYNKFKDTKSGYYIKDETSKNTYNSQNIGLGGENSEAAAGAGATGTVYITLSDQAKKWFDTNVDKLNLDDGTG